MSDELSDRLAKNVRQLRSARGMTQAQVAKLAGLPRATWANLESTAANPTLSVLHRVAAALQVPLEELLASERADVKHYPKGSLPARLRPGVIVNSLLPDKVPGMLIERIEIQPGTEPERAREVQKKASEELLSAFDRGLAVIGFERSPETGTYLLGRWQSN